MRSNASRFLPVFMILLSLNAQRKIYRTKGRFEHKKNAGFDCRRFAARNRCCGGGQPAQNARIELVPAVAIPKPIPPRTFERLRGVHYFADSYPKQFWNSFEPADAARYFKQIRADGFNTSAKSCF